MLLKVVLLAYSRGIVSSRGIERACREHVTFIALSGDSCPHFTTIAAFISGLGELIGQVCKQVLLVCDAQSSPNIYSIAAASSSVVTASGIASRRAWGMGLPLTSETP